MNWFETGEWANGSLWNLGLAHGDPKTVMSTGLGHVKANSDLTQPYNRPNLWPPSSNATDVTQANRSTIWLSKDPKLPKDARFLHVLRGGNMGMSTVGATYVQSLSGTAFDGAVFGSTAVHFPVNLGTISTTTLAVSFSSGTVMIGGLPLGATYTVTTSTISNEIESGRDGSEG